jgi:type III pantothenate kinase
MARLEHIMLVKSASGMDKMSEQVLLLDVGNSRVKWAWLIGEDFQLGGEFTHDGQVDPETTLLPNEGYKPERIVAACVAGTTLQEAVKAWMARQYHQPVTFLSTPAQGCGLTNSYTRPASLGIDRWAAMVAARHQYPGELIVVDVGSAITVDIVQADGQHLGGYILPGLGLMRDALTRGTDLTVEKGMGIVTADTSPGHSTADCIRNGIQLAVCSLVEASYRRLEKTGSETVQCVMTGGQHQAIVAGLTVPCHTEPALVLQGVAVISRSKGTK